MDTIEPIKRTRVRAYGQEFKARVVAECEQPGASVAKVALAHGLNANMIHTWRRELRNAVASPVDGAGEFVSLPLTNAPVAVPGAPIRIEVRRGAMSASIAWPVDAAGACGPWLRELLK
jgi:transposase